MYFEKDPLNSNDPGVDGLLFEARKQAALGWDTLPAEIGTTMYDGTHPEPWVRAQFAQAFALIAIGQLLDKFVRLFEERTDHQ